MVKVNLNNAIMLTALCSLPFSLSPTEFRQCQSERQYQRDLQRATFDSYGTLKRDHQRHVIIATYDSLETERQHQRNLQATAAERRASPAPRATQVRTPAPERVIPEVIIREQQAILDSIAAARRRAPEAAPEAARVSRSASPAPQFTGSHEQKMQYVYHMLFSILTGNHEAGIKCTKNLVVIFQDQLCKRKVKTRREEEVISRFLDDAKHMLRVAEFSDRAALVAAVKSSIRRAITNLKDLGTPQDMLLRATLGKVLTDAERLESARTGRQIPGWPSVCFAR